MSTKPNKTSLIKGSLSEMKLPRPFRPREMPNAASNIVVATQPNPIQNSPNSEEAISTFDPVTSRPVQNMNLSPVQAATGSPGEPITGSSQERVTTRSGRPMHLSPRSDIIQSEGPDSKHRRAPTLLRDRAIKAKDNYCAIPQVVFCKKGLFETPYDLAVYLYLFSRSYGFGRNTCDMGIAEIAAFTRLAKNSVRKSLDRLIEAKWIRIIQSYESCIVARKWRVYSPYEMGITDEPTYYQASELNDPNPPSKSQATDSKRDPITPRPSPSVTPGGASADPVTGSRRDTYKNSIQIQIQKLSLSCENEKLNAYFSELKPARKRESEWQAFLELKNEYTESEIADCLDWINQHGVGNGNTCHSPMAFLAIAISEIIGQVREKVIADTRRAESLAQAQQLAQNQAKKELAEAQQHEIQLQAFRRFHAGRDESEVVAEITRLKGFPIATGQLGRSFAISNWWNGLSDQERAIATQEAIA